MADAPAGGAGAGSKLDPQAAIAKHSAITQAGAGADAAIIARVENAIAHSPMGWLQSVLGETNSRASSERGQVQGKIDEHKSLVASNQKDAPADAGHPPALGTPAHPAVPHPAAAADKGPASAQNPATGGAAAPNHPMPSGGIQKAAAGGAAADHPAQTVAAAVAGAGSDSQLDGILNGYTPKGQQATQTIGRIKQMGDIAQGFNGSLDVYIAQGGAVERGIAGVSNFFGMGKDVSAVWATNPYRKVHGILGGIMTGLSAVKNVCSVVGSVCGKLGLVLTVIGLLGMIFPPIGVAVSGIARILNVVGLICDGISFVLSGILTGLNGVVLAKQIAAGASAEEKAATADLMMSEANDAASGLVNMALIFGPKFMKGLLGNSKGILGSLMRRAKAAIGRVSLKISADIKHFANRVVRKLGFGGATWSRVGDTWKDTGLLARTGDAIKNSKVGKAFYGAPQHIETIQSKLMAKYGNTAWAKNLDRVGAWSGSVAHKIDFEEKLGSWGERSGKSIGNLGQNSDLGKSMASAADRAERDTREAAMHAEARDAAHLEESRWKNEFKQRQRQNPGMVRDKSAEQTFIQEQKDKVRQDSVKKFEVGEQKLATHERVDALRKDRFERHNDEYLKNETGGLSQTSARDDFMGGVHGAREKRWGMEAQYQAQEQERKTLLGKTARSAEDDARLSSLNHELRPLDDARRISQLRENELSGLAAGSERVRKPDYSNWKDVSTNVWDSSAPMLEMLHLKNKDAAWAKAEKVNLAKFDKGAAKSGAAGRGGHGTYAEILTAQRHQNEADFAAFVRSSPQRATIAGAVRGMLSGITGRAPQPQVAGATAGAQPAQTPAPGPGPSPVAAHTPPAAGAAHAPSDAAGAHAPDHADPATAGAGAAQTVTATATAQPAPTHQEPTHGGPAGDAGGAAADEGGGEALPYWPALLPEFDQATHDFGYMRKVAVEFRKAQIDGKQKAVDTLAVYGRYQEYAKLRQAAAQNNQAASHQTGQSIQQNVDHAGQTQQQAGQGEQKQGEARGAATDRAAVDLPEPESRGFWGRILGAVKRWAKNKAAQVFGWIQEKIASVVLKGLCGVSMGDMREYAGALRRQQASAHGVADTAGKTSGQAQSASVKLGSDASKEAQGAADAIGECDRNIVEADQFMADIASFEQQLAEEKAYAQTFIAQIHAAAHAEQARQKADAEKHAQEQAMEHARAAALGGGADPTAASATPTPTPTPTPDAHAGGAPGAAPDAAAVAGPGEDHNSADVGQIHAASDFVATSADSMVGQLEARAENYRNELAMALTNHTGKDQQGHDLKGPSKRESAHIVEEFKAYAQHTKVDMEAFHSMSIDPSATRRIADTIIQTAEHLEANFHDSQQHLDELFERTYTGIRDGKRTLKSSVLDGDNIIGEANRKGEHVGEEIVDHANPVLDGAWNHVAAPIQQAPLPPVGPHPDGN